MKTTAKEFTGPTLAAQGRHVLEGSAIEVTPALTVLDGPSLGECHRLTARERALVLGRGSESNVLLSHPTVSRQHARVFVTPAEGGLERVKIVDTQSRNGTFVNGERVEEAFLVPGDRVHLGDVLLRFDLMDPTEAEFLDTVATLVKEADRDTLTGLQRRAVLERRGPELVAGCQVRAEPASLIMLDLDYFKRINDTFGHPAGDDVLRLTGQVVLASVRSGDLAVRYGGEEIAVVLPRAGIAAAQRIAGRIAAGLGVLELKAPLAGVRITASQGLAEAAQGESLADLILRADSALLTAKRAGRDRVEVAPARSS